jgi:multidrug efflux pump subunit AcrA (membrane-fusion protein)
MREANMKKRRWPWIVGITAVVAVLVGPLVLGGLNQVTQYETYEVKPTEVIKTVSANGQLAESQLLAYGPSEEPVLVSANGSVALPAQFGLSLEIEEIQVKAGDEVKAEDVLFSYLNQMGQSIEVVAISDGLVRSIDTAAGLRTSGSVLTVGSAQPIVSVFVSEYDADLVTLGQKATIELDAINAVFEGEVVRIGQVAQSVSGIKQYEVLVDVTAIPEGARFGMSATAVIEVQKKSDVLAVPMSSLIGDVPEVEILIVDAEGKQNVETVEVKLGLAGDSLVEVTSGLESGDQVITGVSGSIPAPVNFGPPPGARNSG